ncbi:MAG: hypothetical protein WEC00_08280 [Dongiaceae bacterium]
MRKPKAKAKAKEKKKLQPSQEQSDQPGDEYRMDPPPEPWAALDRGLGKEERFGAADRSGPLTFS